jgi:hypothetical protein
MTKALVDRFPFNKVIVVLTIVLVASFGLCGVGAGIGGLAQKSVVGSYVMGGFLVVGGIGFWLSVLGFLVLLPLWIVLALIKALSGGSDGVD